MGILLSGVTQAYLHTSTIDATIAHEVGDSEAHVMSQKAATASFANALTGTASGNDITLDDVSPFPAPVKAKVRSKNAVSPARLVDDSVNSSLAGEVITCNFKDGALHLNRNRTYFVKKGNYTLLVEPLGDAFSAAVYFYAKSEVDKGGYNAFITKYIGSKARYVAPITATEDFALCLGGYNSQYGEFSFRIALIPEGADPIYSPHVADGTIVNIMTGGKNLLTYPYAEQIKAGSSVITKNGITFTVNDDGTVLVNGTATGNVYFTLWNSRSTAYGNELYDIILPKAAMLSGCPAGGGTNYRLAASRDDNSANIVQEYGSGVQMKSEGYDEVYIRIQSGYTANNLLFKPMIEYGTTKTEYEPYKGGGFKSTFVGADVELKYASPNMNIAVDDVCANLEVEYNRDPTIVIDKLTQAIISLGGNI